MAQSKCKVIENDNPIDVLLNTKFTNPARKGYVEVGKDKACVPIYYQGLEKEFDNFEVRDDDVFLCGFPKTGTTWASEMIWLIANDLNYEEAKKKSIYERFYQLDSPCQFDFDKVKMFEIPIEFRGFNGINSIKSPRFIKLHFHWSLFPGQIKNNVKSPKMIYILRRPEDVCVSYYHYSRGMTVFSGTFDEFVELFLAGRVNLGPYWSHVLSFWRQRHRSNILFIKYAELKKNPKNVIKDVAKFLNKNLTEEQISTLVDHINLENMKANPSTNMSDLAEALKALGSTNFTFIRKGQVDSYKSEMNPELIDRFKKWNEKHLKGETISFE